MGKVTKATVRVLSLSADDLSINLSFLSYHEIEDVALLHRSRFRFRALHECRYCNSPSSFVWDAMVHAEAGPLQLEYAKSEWHPHDLSGEVFRIIFAFPPFFSFLQLNKKLKYVLIWDDRSHWWGNDSWRRHFLRLLFSFHPLPNTPFPKNTCGFLTESSIWRLKKEKTWAFPSCIHFHSPSTNIPFLTSPNIHRLGISIMISFGAETRNSQAPTAPDPFSYLLPSLEISPRYVILSAASR